MHTLPWDMRYRNVQCSKDSMWAGLTFASFLKYFPELLLELNPYKSTLVLHTNSSFTCDNERTHKRG